MLIILLIGILFLYKYADRFNSKLRSLLTVIFSIIYSLFIAVIAVEVYLHVAQPSLLVLEGSIRGDLTDYDSKGCLDRDAIHRPKGAFRILGLGDSFAIYGCQQGWNYHNFLQEDLKAGGHGGDVINAGTAGIGPGYYWHMLKEYGDLWKPDLVLVGFFLGNDFEEMDFKYTQIGYFIKEARDPWQRWLNYVNGKGLWLYQFLKRRSILFLDQRHKEKERKASPAGEVGTFSNRSFLAFEKKRMWIFEKDKKAELDALWISKRELLLKFKEWCAQRNAGLVIAIFPDQFQIDARLRQEIFQSLNLEANAFDLSYPNRLVSAYCREQGIPCLDLTGPFQQDGGSRNLYRPLDTHWNEAGNRLAARLMFEYLTQNGLIRGSSGILPK
jgi:hypothetical protein